MDLAQFSKSLSNEIVSNITLECNRVCLNEETGIPSKECIQNCSYKQA